MATTLDRPAEKASTPSPAAVVSPDFLARLQTRPAPAPLSYRIVKAVLDFVLAALLLLLTWPIILVCAVLVKLTSPGPAFYAQIRLGYRGRPFWILKLRTMTHDCEARSGPKWSVAGDARITPLGRYLRALHLDELPQLWNILRGEMSLIGPRPERPEFIPSLAAIVPHYELRLLARPGVTGLAQVQLPADSDTDSVRAKVTHDLYASRQASLWLDLRILVATVFKVFGVSFANLRTLFAFPEPEVIEKHYGDLPAQPEPCSPVAPEEDVPPGELACL